LQYPDTVLQCNAQVAHQLEITKQKINDKMKNEGLRIAHPTFTILILKEFFYFPRESHSSPLSAAVPTRAPYRLTISNFRISFPILPWHDFWINTWQSLCRRIPGQP
jgi:hypothetical protein